jgi:hypothetical protein
MTRLIARLALAAALATSAACGSDAASPVIPAFDDPAQLDVNYTLTLFGGDGQWDIRLDAVVRNKTNTTRILPVGGCTLQLYVYANPAGTGAEAWAPSHRAGGCKLPTSPDTIAAGDSITIAGTRTSTNEILANSGAGPPNPPGSYFFFATLGTTFGPSESFRRFVGFATLR